MTEELLEEAKKNVESDPKKKAFQDIFKIDEEELLDMIESENLRHESGGEEEVKEEPVAEVA